MSVPIVDILKGNAEVLRDVNTMKIKTNKIADMPILLRYKEQKTMRKICIILIMVLLISLLPNMAFASNDAAQIELGDLMQSDSCEAFLYSVCPTDSTISCTGKDGSTSLTIEYLDKIINVCVHVKNASTSVIKAKKIMSVSLVYDGKYRYSLEVDCVCPEFSTLDKYTNWMDFGAGNYEIECLKEIDIVYVINKSKLPQEILYEPFSPLQIEFTTIDGSTYYYAIPTDKDGLPVMGTMNDFNAYDYYSAVKLFNKGRLLEAKALFEPLGQYKDSADYCERCAAAPQIKETECQYCNGTGTVICSHCNGTERVLKECYNCYSLSNILNGGGIDKKCSICHGAGFYSGYCDKCAGGLVTCPKCNGFGFVSGL